MHESPLFIGRPELGSRSEIEEKCYELLEALSIDFTRVDHDSAMTMDDLAAAEKVLSCPIAKNLFLTNRQQTDFYLLIMPGNKPFKTKYLSAQLGCSRLSFATEEHLETLLGVKSGSASLLGLMNDTEKKVQLVFDAELLESTSFACHPCINSSTLAFDTSEIFEKILPAFGREYREVSLPREGE